ncbi:unnamed protein product [Gadus morhua 'NCC']
MPSLHANRRDRDSLSNCIRLFSTGGRILQEEQGELEGIQSERRGRGNSSWKQERQRKSRPDPCKHHSRHRIKSVPSSHAKPRQDMSFSCRGYFMLNWKRVDYICITPI